MAVARLAVFSIPYPPAASRRAPSLRLPFAPLPVRAQLPRRAAGPVPRVASDGRADAEPDETPAAPPRSAKAEGRAARKESERRTYLIAAVMSSLGITTMAAAAVYYRFAWQMEVPQLPAVHGNSTFPTFKFHLSLTLMRHFRAVRGRRGRDGVLGAVGAPGAVARLALAHARVAPPPARRALRAQRRLRHHQRRPGHGPPRLRLLQPRPHPGTLLRRGARDYAVRDGVHVRPRRPCPPPLPRGSHRERALLPAGGRRPSDSSHGQVRQRAVWAVPWSQGAGGGGWDRGAREGDQEADQEETDLGLDPMRATSHIYSVFYVFSKPSD